MTRMTGVTGAQPGSGVCTLSSIYRKSVTYWLLVYITSERRFVGWVVSPPSLYKLLRNKAVRHDGRRGR